MLQMVNKVFGRNEYFDALKILISKLVRIDYAIVGSYNLFLQGIKIVPHDLDLISDDLGISKIGKIFSSEIITNRNGYKETEFRINAVDVHVVSTINNQIRPPFRNHIIRVEKDGLKIMCMSLTSELLFYKKINREKDNGKVKLIREKLAN